MKAGLIGWGDMYQRLKLIDEIRELVRDRKKRLEAQAAHSQDAPVGSIDAQVLANEIGESNVMICRPERLIQTSGAMERLIESTRGRGSYGHQMWVHAFRDLSMPYRTAIDRMTELLDCIEQDIFRRETFILAPDKQHYFIMGPAGEVESAFPGAVGELSEAQKCIALERYTASVFHMMRAAEFGLRSLVMAIGVKKPKEHLDFEAWKYLVDQLKCLSGKYIDTLKGDKQKTARLSAKEFFNATIDNYGAFMDDVRNIVMHTRRSYREREALSIHDRVSECLVRSARYVGEHKGKINKSTFKVPVKPKRR
jgi:hypothetical protein